MRIMVKIKKIGKILGFVILALFVMGVIGYGAAYYISYKELKKEFQKIRDSGEPLTLDELYSSPIPDEENAALIYQKAFALMDVNKEEIQRITGIPLNKKAENWPAEDKEEATRLILKNNEIFTLLEEAAQKPKCRFPLNPEKGLPIESLSHMRRCAQLLNIKASLEAKDGDINGAIKTCITGLMIGESLSQESLLISQMFMISIDTIMARAIEDILTKIEVNNADYDDLYMALKRVREKGSVNLKGELCFTTDYALRHKKSEVLCVDKRKAKNIIWLLYYTKLGRPWFKMNQIYYLRTMAKAISISNKPYRQATNILDEYRKSIPKYCTSIRMLTESIKEHFQHEACHDALIGAGEIAIELRLYKSRHGKYPDTVKELALNTTHELPFDPFTEQSYIYRKEKEGFIVYSVGANFKDDGGKYERHGGLYELDIVWRCEI